MQNPPVMDFNSTFNSTSNVVGCLKPAHVGTVVEFTALSLCSFVGTPAHSWLLWLLFRDGWKIKPTQVFPLNLIILELTYCVQCVVQMLNRLIFKDQTLARVTYFFYDPGWIGRPLIQICICVEQYLAVLHPIIFLKYKGVQYRIVLATVIWLIVTACASYQAFSEAVIESFVDVVFVLAVAVISFCCVSVLRALKLPRPGDTQITRERGRDVGNQQKRNAFNTIFEGLLIIVFSYLPQVSVCFISLIKLDEELLRCDVVPIISSFNNMGVLIKPLLKMYKDCHQKCLNY